MFGERDEREERRSSFWDLNYLIPVMAKEAGYEIIRNEEVVGVNLSMIKKIARAIHSRYLHEIIKAGRSARTKAGRRYPSLNDLPAELTALKY